MFSFNITHIHRELNSLSNLLVVYSSSAQRKLLPLRPDFVLQSLYQCHLPNNEEHWQVFSNDDCIFSIIQGQTTTKKEIISHKDNKYPKGPSPLRNYLPLSNISQKKEIPRKELEK